MDTNFSQKFHLSKREVQAKEQVSVVFCKKEFGTRSGDIDSDRNLRQFICYRQNQHLSGKFTAGR